MFRDYVFTTTFFLDFADPGTPGPKNGGYGTVAPSKFISDDGRTLWLQANWFVGVGPRRTPTGTRCAGSS